MRDDALAAAAVGCARCGYLAGVSGGTANFCPKCGADLRASDEPRAGEPLAEAGRGGADPPRLETRPAQDDERTYTSAWIGQGQIIAERYRLVEMLGEQPFRAITEAPYPFTLAPYGFYWLRIDPPNEGEQNVGGAR